jgi:hypothetical protein
MLCQKSNTELLQLAEQIGHIWHDYDNSLWFIVFIGNFLWGEGVRVVELFEFTDDCSESSIVLYV